MQSERRCDHTTIAKTDLKNVNNILRIFLIVTIDHNPSLANPIRPRRRLFVLKMPPKLKTRMLSARFMKSLLLVCPLLRLLRGERHGNMGVNNKESRPVDPVIAYCTDSLLSVDQLVDPCHNRKS